MLYSFRIGYGLGLPLPWFVFRTGYLPWFVFRLGYGLGLPP
jgi:hypothetical protein